jgi:tetratricopeptide (TPR) repeat protein
MGTFDLRMRIAVASHSVLFYLWETLWPLRLSPFSPLPGFDALHHWPYAAYPVLVVLVSVLLAKNARQAPALCAAWAWYLIVLFPVSGFIQCGGQFAADRYSYFPSLSVALLLGGGLLRGLQRLETSRARGWLAAAAAALLLGWGLLTARQIRVWHDTLSLWSHVVRLDPESVGARNNLGAALAEGGRLEEAVLQFQLVLQMDPRHDGARRNLKKALELLRARSALSGRAAPPLP